jgi:ketosteroid isomerase-like protein
MQPPAGLLLATTVLTSITLAACTTPSAPQQDDKQAATNVVLAYEQAVQAYDFDKVDSLNTPDSRVIEESYPHPLEPAERRDWQPYTDAGLHVDYHPQDAIADLRGNVAWVTVTMHSVWKADTPAGRTILGGSAWRATYVETFILVKTPAGWKIAFRHTTTLPADFGVESEYQQEHGGMKFVKVTESGPADKAGLKPGDVLIEYGGQKIDNADDFYKLRYAHSEGEKVTVTVIRGRDKITREVTLDAMR